MADDLDLLLLAPKAPWFINQETADAYAQIWQDANRLNYAYLPYRDFPMPQRPTCEYCGRSQDWPADGGCVSCGAPLPGGHHGRTK